MVETYLRRSPLAHLGLEGHGAEKRAKEAGVALGEIAFRGTVNLRLDPKDSAIKNAAEGALPCSLPTKVGETASGGSGKAGKVTALCLGPDEWWLIAADGPKLAEKLKKALAKHHAAVTDIGENWTTLQLSGPRARDLLAKACPLDLHPSIFPVGHCAQSLGAKADITLLLVEDGKVGPTFELWVRRSFAAYLWAWLEDAAREYGLTIVKCG
ncbi:MAG: sarcosine oxidase subunit gamma family protein [Rhodovibrionaceae bacterium]